MSFTQDRLRETLATLPGNRRYLLAYSGGRDSCVLLHSLAGLAGRLSAELRVLHVDHRLQPASAGWARHCERVCADLGVDCEILPLGPFRQKGQSPEAQAREARYRVLAEHLGPDEVLMTAHHRDDQAETVMLQLLRGAGPAGLAAMPAVCRFGPGYLARPLLQFTRSELEAYATEHDLQWVEDPSNQDTGLDRNYLRQRVMPLLEARWPACSRTLSRSARHCAEAQALIDEKAAADMAPLVDAASRSLSSSGVAALAPPRGRAVLRRWISDNGFPLPGSARLDRVLHEMTGAARDRNPLVHWPHTEVRRYRDRLYLMPPLAHHDPDQVLGWDGVAALQLPGGLGQLRLVQGPGGLARRCWPVSGVEVRFRHAGERLRPAQRANSLSFKKLFQQHAVPPWLRSRIPLLYIDGKLAAVADLCVCQPFAAAGEEPGLRVVWDKPACRVDRFR